MVYDLKILGVEESVEYLLIVSLASELDSFSLTVLEW